MRPLTSLTRWCGALCLTLALASACGGHSFSGKGNEAGGPSGSGAAGTGSGGGAHAGSGSVGGAPLAGSASGGFAAGGAGGDACTAPPDAGLCAAAIPSWYHDPITDACFPFTWGGCQGNANNHGTQSECERICGAAIDPFACNVPQDCAIGTASCCGRCDGPNLWVKDFQAFNRQYADRFGCGVAFDAIPQGGAAGGEIVCPPCPAPPPGQGSQQYFVPDCLEGRCVVSDLRTSPLTECKVDGDCMLRNGTDCCQGCGGDQYVAVRSDGSFEDFACGGVAQPCIACLPIPNETTIAAHCGSSGHCEVVNIQPAAR